MSLNAPHYASHDTLDRIISLTSAEIHLWLADYNEITDSGLHADYRGLLDSAEKAQEPRFYFERDRPRYLVTRALVRTVLSRYARIDPADCTLSTNAYGLPPVPDSELTDSSC